MDLFLFLAMSIIAIQDENSWLDSPLLQCEEQLHPHPSLSPCLGYNPCLMWHCCEDRSGGDRWLNTGRLSVERALSLYLSKHLQMCSKGNVNIY